MVILAPTTPEKRQFISSGIEVEIETGRKDIKLGFFFPPSLLLNVCSRTLPIKLSQSAVHESQNDTKVWCAPASLATVHESDNNKNKLGLRVRETC